MKKLLTYTLITSLITCFSYVNPSFADTQVKNENIIKLDLNETKVFNLAYNNDLFLANNVNTTTNEMDCSGKQNLYILSGGFLGGIGGALLAWLLGLGLASSASVLNQPSLEILYTTIFIGVPVGALVGVIFGAFKGNDMAVNECNSNKKR